MSDSNDLQVNARTDVNVRKIQIKEMGSYLEVDERGFLINPASVHKIGSQWKPIVDDIVQAYVEHCGEYLHSVYVRGSVAKGTALPGVSDVDTFAYVNLTKQQLTNTLDQSWIDGFEKELAHKYPFAQSFEIYIDSVERAMKDKVVLLQSACVYGIDVTKEIPPMKADKELLGHIYSFKKDLSKFEEWATRSHTRESVMEKCTWLMKRFLRTGLELVLVRSGTYTRDLYPSYKVFAKYYPEHEPHMRDVLDLALNPTDDIRILKKIVGEFGVWVVDEIERQLAIH
jgi:uncharacterized protein